MSQPIDQRIGQNLVRWRQMAAMTQQELARLVRVDVQQLAKFEAGRERVTPGQLLDLARALNIPVANLFDGVTSQLFDQALPQLDRHFLEQPEALELLGYYFMQPPAARRAHLAYLKELSNWQNTK